ncbi:MAG: Crp/Fnr family transcriptional regulator [Chloroflexi bacterium]|nr:Crp/Fnr family transcriptional regulator [Chloroflexota bacterium]
MNTVNVLRNHILFNGLSSVEVQHILPQLRNRDYQAGQNIFHAKQTATCLFLLVEGLVRVGYIAPNGDYKILDICEEGDIFGEMFLGDYRFRIGQAQAMTEASAYILREEELYALIHRYPQIAINFIRHLSDSKRRLFARLHALQRTEAKSRLLGTLLSLARTMCCQSGSYFVLNQAITQQDIADMTGLNRSTVSSLINRLRQAEILGGTGRYLVVDVPHMEKLLHDEGFELLE